MKTLAESDILRESKNWQSPIKLQIHFHEASKELLCRSILFLHILHENNLNFDERIELFLDLYANSKIKYFSLYLGKETPVTWIKYDWIS